MYVLKIKSMAKTETITLCRFVLYTGHADRDGQVERADWADRDDIVDRADRDRSQTFRKQLKEPRFKKKY